MLTFIFIGIFIALAFYFGYLIGAAHTADKSNKRLGDIIGLYAYVQQVNTAVNHWQIYNASPVREGDKEKALSSAYKAIEGYASVNHISFNGKIQDLQLCTTVLHASTLLICADLEESPEYAQQAIKLIEACVEQNAGAKTKSIFWDYLGIESQLKWVHMMAFAVRYHQSPASTMTQRDAIKALKSFATPTEIETLDPINDRLLAPIYKMANSQAS